MNLTHDRYPVKKNDRCKKRRHCHKGKGDKPCTFTGICQTGAAESADLSTGFQFCPADIHDNHIYDPILRTLDHGTRKLKLIQA